MEKTKKKRQKIERQKIWKKILTKQYWALCNITTKWHLIPQKRGSKKNRALFSFLFLIQYERVWRYQDSFIIHYFVQVTQMTGRWNQLMGQLFHIEIIVNNKHELSTLRRTSGKSYLPFWLHLHLINTEEEYISKELATMQRYWIMFSLLV